MIKYSAKYFTKTKKIISKHKKNSIVTIQFFQREDNIMLCGISEALEILKKHTKTSKYKIKHLHDGDIISSGDVVLELEGYYPLFGEYEGIIDGILARASSLATNAYRLTKVTKKPIIFMGDRADHYLNQERDGYAVSVGGIKTHVTDAQVELTSDKAIGTIPHALIQMFDGNLLSALKAYKSTFKNEKLTALVDFNNDVIGDSLTVLQEFRKDLFAVRVDTSPNMIDKAFSRSKNKEYGVTPNLIKKLRKALDSHRGKHVKIIVSSGFDEEKIKEFEKAKAPVDFYGVGASLLKVWINFSADAVKFNGKLIAKAGRKYNKI